MPCQNHEINTNKPDTYTLLTSASFARPRTRSDTDRNSFSSIAINSFLPLETGFVTVSETTWFVYINKVNWALKLFFKIDSEMHQFFCIILYLIHVQCTRFCIKTAVPSCGCFPLAVVLFSLSSSSTLCSELVVSI